MSANIRVDVALAGLLQRLRAQQVASRQGFLEGQQRKSFAEQLREALQQRDFEQQRQQQVQYDSKRKIVRDELAAFPQYRTSGGLPSIFDVSFGGTWSPTGGTLVTLFYEEWRWTPTGFGGLVCQQSRTVGPTLSGPALYIGVTGYKIIVWDYSTTTCTVGGATVSGPSRVNVFLMFGCMGYQIYASAGANPISQLTLDVTLSSSEADAISIYDKNANPCHADYLTTGDVTLPPADINGYRDFSGWP